MSSKYRFLGLIIAGGVAMGSAFVGSSRSNADNARRLDHAQHMLGLEAAIPTMPGQEAFGTIQEIVQILEADPTTDWSKVNIAALREHLIDMDEVTMRAAANERALVNGVEIVVTGKGRTLEAIKRMLPAHAHELGTIGWNARTENLPNGIKLVVTSIDAKQVTKLKALGFMGVMVQGAHHQIHHLLMAKGEFTH
jgi:NAD(P)H-dependent flavin oxidoreductase YrpB (nitropropane dioxygenase family)